MNDLLEPVLGAERWPPMLGVVGFDGGYKSAVSLAIPPEELVAQDEFVEIPSETTGACCNAGVCDIETEAACNEGGGIYQGDDVPCVGSLCQHNGGGGGPPGSFACCTSGGCFIFTALGCFNAGGFLPGPETCDPDPCPGACCYTNADGAITCDTMFESDCTALFGRFNGPGTDCSGDPCIGTGACCNCMTCTITLEADCPTTGHSGWLGSGVSCASFSGEGNVCCPINDAAICCITGQVFSCWSPADCSLFGGCPTECADDGSLCSC